MYTYKQCQSHLGNSPSKTCSKRGHNSAIFPRSLSNGRTVLKIICPTRTGGRDTLASDMPSIDAIRPDINVKNVPVYVIYVYYICYYICCYICYYICYYICMFYMFYMLYMYVKYVIYLTCDFLVLCGVLITLRCYNGVNNYFS